MVRRNFLVVVLDSIQFVPFVSFISGIIIPKFWTAGRTSVDSMQARTDGNEFRCSGV